MRIKNILLTVLLTLPATAHAAICPGMVIHHEPTPVTIPQGVASSMDTPYEDANSWKVGNWSQSDSGIDMLNALTTTMADLNSKDPITGIYGYYGYESANQITNYDDFKTSVKGAEMIINTEAYALSSYKNTYAKTSGGPSDFFEVTTQSGQVYEIQQTPISDCSTCTEDTQNPGYASNSIQAVNKQSGEIIE